jgi:hypothetical protein
VHLFVCLSGRAAQVRFSFDEPEYAMIDTLVSLAEAHLFMQLVELKDAENSLLPASKTYADLYRCTKGSVFPGSRRSESRGSIMVGGPQ